MLNIKYYNQNFSKTVSYTRIGTGIAWKVTMCPHGIVNKN